MPKRKATDAPVADENPTKRITRSNGALSVTQPIANAQSPTKRRGRPPGIPANAIHKAPPGRAYVKKGTRARSPTTSSLKENERCEDEEDEGQGEEADELNISSENELPSGPARTGRRVVLDSVMVTASRRVKVAAQHAATSKRSKTTALASQSRQESPKRSYELDSASTVDAVEVAPVASPSKMVLGKRPQVVLPKTLPTQLAYCLSSQKQACLTALHDPPFAPEGEDELNSLALKQLTDLVRGTVERGEGNSCLVLGPAGSGKSRVSRYPVVQVRSSYNVTLRFLRRPCHNLQARASWYG